MGGAQRGAAVPGDVIAPIVGCGAARSGRQGGRHAGLSLAKSELAVPWVVAPWQCWGQDVYDHSQLGAWRPQNTRDGLCVQPELLGGGPPNAAHPIFWGLDLISYFFVIREAEP